MENGNIRKNDDALLRLCYVKGDVDGMLGLHLSRAPWDPYPWVSGVQAGSSASIAGLKVGDCVLEVNGENVLGQKIVEVAEKIRQNWKNTDAQYEVTFLLWNSKLDEHVSIPSVNPQHLQKFALCLQNIAQLLECPICLEVAKPPAWQCQNGHVLCDNCRGRTSRCPICRVTLGPKGRCLLAEKVFTLLADSFPCENGQSKWNTKHLENEHDSHQTHQKNLPKKSFTLETVITHPHKMDQFKYNCLSSSSSCPKMKSQHELLIHLQRNHKISVTQYYAALGDKINIKFSDKSVTSIVISKNENLEVFWVMKMRFSSGYRGLRHGKDICWIWYYGDAVEANLYSVKLECNKAKWRGVVNSLEIC
ncbi:hypothetical protein HA402_012340, partial [Bradysia odoriphaga]